MPDGWSVIPEPQGWTPVAAAPALRANDPSRLPTRPVSPEDFTPQEPSWAEKAMGFVRNFAHNVDPRPALSLLYDVAQTLPGGDPLRGAQKIGEDVKALTGAQVEQFRKGKQAYSEGRISEAVGHTLAGATPLVGPAAAAAGEQIGSGDWAGGLGAAAGMLAPMAVPHMLPKSIDVPGLEPANPVTADALALAEREGVPMDAGTATGNRAVRAVQHIADRSLGGSAIAEKAAQAQQQGLATLGEQLAAKGYKNAVTAEQAGEAVRGDVLSQVQGNAAEANAAYGELRRIEADPKHLKTIAIEPEAGSSGAALGRAGKHPTGRFAKVEASTEDLFQGVLGDARRNGFEGSADDLRAEFYDRLSSAKRLGAEQAAIAGESGSGALLSEIRRLGGIKPWENDYIQGAKTQKLRGEFESLQQSFERNHGHKGSGGIFRKDGLGLDDLADQLHADPRFKGLIANDPEALKGVLQDIARKGPEAGSGDFEHLLRATGVEPGAKWWEGSKAVNAQEIPLPVDLRGAKQAMRPIYDRLKRESELVPLQGDKARALTALDRLMSGPSHASLSTVDEALGDLKSFARSDVPELRSAGQGAVAGAIKHLDAVVRKTAADAGPEALEALDAGRAATIAKYGAADVLDKLNAEPVRVHGQLTAPNDAAIRQLRKVAKQAPAALPKIGRAFLDDLLTTATNEGGFSKAGTVAAKWERLGAETKQLLYKDPGYIKDLDSFFHLAKLTAENANPSGTAHTLLVAGQGGLFFTNPIAGGATALGTAAVSKLLHSKVGVRLLTKGFRIPVANRAAAVAWKAELVRQAPDAIGGMVPATADGRQQDPAQAIARQ